MKGSFSKEALLRYSELVEQKQSVSFSEEVTYDFTRCVRPDGSSYGTGGKCRKGTEEAKEEASPKAKKNAGTPSPPPKSLEEYDALMSKYNSMELDPSNLDHFDDIHGKWETVSWKSKHLDDLAKQGNLSAGAEAHYYKKSPEYWRAKESFEAAKNYYEEEHGTEWREKTVKLNPSQTKALEDYTNYESPSSRRTYSAVNDCLRSPRGCPDIKDQAAFVKQIDSALAALPKNEEGVEHYRGVSANSDSTKALYQQLENAQPGTRIKDPGYGSFSSNKETANDFIESWNPGILFVSTSKKLTPVGAYSKIPGEDEALLPRNTELTIRKVTKIGENLIVELD
jgi:hypothetical protein